MMPAQDTKEKRLCARRDQIIAAARICFRKHGFHGAGMAEIAKLSQLSVGQIYRYFANKEAIIEEIVHRIVAKKIQLITGNAHNMQQMAENLASRRIGKSPFNQQHQDKPDIPDEQAAIDHALMLEVAAEATRNPVVEKIWRDSECGLFNQAKSMMGKAFPHWSEEELNNRVEIVAVICEGSAFRHLTARHAETCELEKLYNQLFDQLFNPPSSGQS